MNVASLALRAVSVDRRAQHSPRWLPVSQRARKRIEEVFDWVKTVGGGRNWCYCGIARNRRWVEMTTAGYNLVRLPKLTAVVA